MLAANRVSQETSLPLKKASFTPALRALRTLVNWLWVQYSSCPEDMKTLWLSRSAGRVDTSTPER